jgi:hypothetical protein
MSHHIGTERMPSDAFSSNHLLLHPQAMHGAPGSDLIGSGKGSDFSHYYGLLRSALKQAESSRKDSEPSWADQSLPTR